MPDSTAASRLEKPGPGFVGRALKATLGPSMMVLWIAALFCGAGRFNWKRGWVCAAVYVLAMMAMGALVHRFNPGLLQARAKGMRKNTQSFDKVFTTIFFPLTFVQVFVAGLDAARFRWIAMPDWTIFPGIPLFLAAVAMVCWTMMANPFAETTVRIQTERDHRVVSAGPYRVVRHPMYVGSLLMYPATALMLGSGLAMAIALLMDILFVWRTGREDRFLQSQLPGYRQYAARTRYRLCPGVW